MFEIDKKKFGAFVSELRREKGYTQRELAEKLYISDKAVSKWETAVSIPDTALLIPLAELLDVTVTELLMCERVKSDVPMDAGQVEDVVKTALTYSEEKAARAYQVKSKWPLIYLCSMVIGAVGILTGYQLHVQSVTLFTAAILGAVFGAYFCIFVKTKLPAYYDENRCGLYYDGFFRMNIPGVAFNNSNWPHILRAARIWSCLTISLYPFILIVMNLLNAALWVHIETVVCLVLLLGGLFVPIYVLGRKYQ